MYELVRTCTVESNGWTTEATRRDKAGRSFAFKYNVDRDLIDVTFNQPIRGKKLDSIQDALKYSDYQVYKY